MRRVFRALLLIGLTGSAFAPVAGSHTGGPPSGGAKGLHRVGQLHQEILLGNSTATTSGSTTTTGTLVLP